MHRLVRQLPRHIMLPRLIMLPPPYQLHSPSRCKSNPCPTLYGSEGAAMATVRSLSCLHRGWGLVGASGGMWG